MWASDYPHPATTWPNSKADLERQFDGISDDVRAKISYENVIALYGLDSDGGRGGLISLVAARPRAVARCWS